MRRSENQIEPRVRCERQSDGITAKVIRYWPGTPDSQLLGYVKLLNNHYYPSPISDTGVRLQPTHKYRQQSHAMRHLIDGTPGDDAISLDIAVAGPNPPLTFAPPVELDMDTWQTAA